MEFIIIMNSSFHIPPPFHNIQFKMLTYMKEG